MTLRHIMDKIMLLMYTIIIICLLPVKPGDGLKSHRTTENAADEKQVQTRLVIKDGVFPSKMRGVDRSSRSYQTFDGEGGFVGNRESNHHEHNLTEFYGRYGNGKVPVGLSKAINPECNRRIATLTCRTVPASNPPGVTTVIVTSQVTHIQDFAFQDPSFANVLHLSLNGIGLSMFSVSSFDGLKRVTNLTLTGMDELLGTSLQLALLKSGVLPNLKYFALNPGETFSALFIKFESNFLKKLANYHMDYFNLINIISEVKFVDLFEFALESNLNTMNLTGSFLVIDYSQTNAYTDIQQTYLSKPILDVLDSSRLRTTNVTESSAKGVVNDYIAGPHCYGTHAIYPEFLLVEIWYANDIYPGISDFQGFCNLSTTQMFLKKLVFTGNNIPKFNVTFIFPKNNTLRYVDLSNNRLQYIGPGVFPTALALEQLVLSNNRLHQMEHSPEFESLLKPLERLAVLDLSNNNISFLPLNTFLTNRRLNTLILANNCLTTLSFELEPLSQLLMLDIRGNLIATLENNVLSKLQLVFGKHHDHLAILFEKNPIKCLCESKAFIEWLVLLKGFTKESIRCHYGSNYIDVEKDAVGKCNYLCIQTIVIAVSTLCSVGFVALLISMGVVIKRLKKRKKLKGIEWQLTEIIQAGNFMCFMAISGNDEILVERVILENLRRLLQGKVGLNRDLICTGTRFKPGFSICEEAYRLMKQCQVFIAVVSESFMRSQYCKIELQEACKQNKPTILIFLGHVETEDMPPYMQEVFRRTSRAWIKQNDEGYYYVVPNLIDMTGAIWDLAIADLVRNQN